jgi:hypothetical protein
MNPRTTQDYILGRKSQSTCARVVNFPFFQLSICTNSFYLRGEYSLYTAIQSEMSTQATRKRVQPLNLSASGTSFFRKPNATQHEHFPRKCAKISKTHSSSNQPSSTYTASTLFTFTHALASTLLGAMSTRNTGTNVDTDQPSIECAAPQADGGQEDGGFDQARASKVSAENSRRCSLVTNLQYRDRTKCLMIGFMNWVKHICITSWPQKLFMIRVRAVFNVWTQLGTSINAGTVCIAGHTVAAVS